jgi:hypothetical protein
MTLSLSTMHTLGVAFLSSPSCRTCLPITAQTSPLLLPALSDAYFEHDLVAIQVPHMPDQPPRLCVVQPDGLVAPVCQREDDVPTDVFADPREYTQPHWKNVMDDWVVGRYGEGFYGQRPVPSLGGGPGYGADADEVWSVDESVLERVREEGVALPVLDVGIAHGEKARGGFLG